MPSVGTITGTLRLVDLFSGPLAASTKKLAATASSMEVMGQKASILGGKMTRGITVPVIAAGAAAFYFASQFETAMTKVETLSGAGREQVNAWTDDLLKMAEETGRSPVELAEALFFLASAGLETSQIMTVLRDAAMGAAIGMGNTEVIAGTLTSVTNSYSSSNLTATSALNTLMAGIKEGTAEVDAFSPALGRLASMGASLQIPFEDVVGILSVMSITQLNVAETSTSLSQVFNTLLGAGEKSDKMLAQMGLSSEQLRFMVARPGGLLEVIELLGESFTLDELKAVMPNIRGLRGLMNVLAQDSEKVADIMLAVGANTDLVNDAFETTTETGGFKFDQLISVLITGLIKLGQGGTIPALIDLIKDFVKWLTSLVDVFRALPEPLQDATIKFFAFMVIVGPSISVLSKATLGVIALANAFKLAGVWIGAKAALGFSAVSTAIMGIGTSITAGNVGLVGGMSKTFQAASKTGNGLAFALKQAAHFALLFATNLVTGLLPALAAVAIPLAVIAALTAAAKWGLVKWNASLDESFNAAAKFNAVGAEFQAVLQTMTTGLAAAQAGGTKLNASFVETAEATLPKIVTALREYKTNLTEVVDEYGEESAEAAIARDQVAFLFAAHAKLKGMLEQVTPALVGTTEAIVAQAEADYEAGLAAIRLREAQERWGVIVENLRTPLQNYVRELFHMIDAANEAQVSSEGLEEQFRRLVITAGLMEGFEFELETGGFTDDFMSVRLTVDEVVAGVEEVSDTLVGFDPLLGEQLKGWQRIKAEIWLIGQALGETFEQIAGDAISGLLHGEGLTEVLTEAGGQAGAAIGDYFGGPIGAAIGEVIGEEIGAAIGGIFDKPSLKEQITGFFDNFDAGTATIAETTKGIDLLAKGLTNLKPEVALRLLTENFDAVLEAAERLGGGAVDALARLTAAAQESGVGLELIAEALQDKIGEALDVLEERAQLFGDSAATILLGIEKMGLGTAASVEFASDAIVVAFSAMITSGASMTEIAEALGEQFARIAEAGEGLGTIFSEEFERIGVVIEALAEGPLANALESLEGVAEVTQAIGDIGLLTAEQFDFLGSKIQGTYNKLIEGGLNHQEALATVAPSLQTLWDLSQQYGFSISNNNMALIEQAGALGLVTDKGLTTESILVKGFDKMLEALNAIIVALGGVPILLNDWGASATDVGNAWSDTTNEMESDIARVGKTAIDTAAEMDAAYADAADNFGIEWQDAFDESTSEANNFFAGLGELVTGWFSGSGGNGSSLNFTVDYNGPVVQSFSGGSGGIQNFGSGQMAELHGREEVLTEGQGDGVVARINAALNGNSGGGESSELLSLTRTNAELALSAHEQRETQIDRASSIDRRLRDDTRNRGGHFVLPLNGRG